MATAEDLLKQAEDHLQKIFGFSAFRPGQREILEAVLNGKDALVIMPTGGGKSLCFQLPSLLKPGVTLVVSPLISLMKDQVDSLQMSGFPATFINSSLSANEHYARLEGMQSGQFKLVYVAPERFASANFMDRLRAINISLLAVDEAHCISQWGHDFRPAYTKLAQVREQLGSVQTIALTATATTYVQKDIVKQLRLQKHEKFIAGFDRPNLHFSVDSIQDKLEGVLNFVRNNQGMGIIYAATRKHVGQVAAALRVAKIPSAAYHAGLPDHERKRVQENFLNEKVRVIVATNAFGMGIDKSNVRFVLHFGMPGSIEAYYQEAGRAGRDGDDAECVLFYGPEDRFIQEFFVSMNNPAVELILQVFEILDEKRASEDAAVCLEANEIARMLDIKEDDFAVESVLRFLMHRGHIVRVGGSGNQILLAIPEGENPHAQNELARDLELLVSASPNGGKWWPTTIFEVAQIFGLPVDKAVERLKELVEAHTLRQAGPFAKRGFFILKPPELHGWKKYLAQRYEEGMARLEAMVRYCQTAACRRKFILDYFGEKHEKEKCDGCDNCERELIFSADNTILVQKILSCVVRMGERFGVVAIAEVLAGSSSERALRFSHLSTYGSLPQYGLGEIKKEIRRTMAAGYLASSGGEYPVLKVTDTGWEVLHGNRQAALPEPEEEMLAKKRLAESHFDAQLFEELRRLRLGMARSRNIPPYIIFTDKTLKEMATYYPTKPEDFYHITGIGEEKMRTLVPKFMIKIREYVNRHREEIKNAPSATSPKWQV
jgi:ATP-dependent DNA helicase RecQ